MYQSATLLPSEPIEADEFVLAHDARWSWLARQTRLPTQSDAFLTALKNTMLRTCEVREIQHIDGSGLAACIALTRAQGSSRRWHMAGDDAVYEPNDALWRDDASLAELAQLLASDRDPMELARIPAMSPLIPALRRAIKGKGVLSVRASTPSPYITLNAAWREPKSCFSSRRRSDFRRAQRKAAEYGCLEFETISPTAAQFGVLFDEAVAIEARSWKMAANSAMACAPAKAAFFRDYLTRASAKRQCRVSFMRVEGKAVAMHLAVVWNERYWLFKIGYDEAYGRCSPGTLLMLHTIGEAAREGCTSFEFMGESESWITDLWTKEQHDCVRVRTYPFSSAGMVMLVADGWDWGKERLSRPRRAAP